MRLIRGQALLHAGIGQSGAARRETWLAADATLTALIDELRVGHPLLGPAYALRADVRRRLGRDDDADGDLIAAQRASTNDPGVIEQTAGSHAARGRFDAALTTLQARVVEEYPALLAMRADILAALQRRTDAKADLDRAVGLLEAGDAEDSAIAHVARSAMLLGERSIAESAYGRMSEAGRDAWDGRVIAADLAFLGGNVDDAAELYREAAGKAPDPRAVLRNLALRLLEANRPGEAQAAFEESDVDDMSGFELEPYAVSAFRANDLATAQRVIERLAGKGPLPPWALGMAADIELRRGDPEAAARHLLALETQGAGSARVHLALARCLVEIGDVDGARGHAIDALGGTPTPSERCDAAVILKELGLPDEALGQAFRAYREDRGDPRIQAVLAMLTFTAGAVLEQPDAVAANTHVKLRGANGGSREHSIFGDDPINKAAAEMTVEEAASAGLLGKQIGEVVERDAGRWSHQAWTVEEILPAEVHAARVIIQSFSDTFPDEPPIFWTIPMGDDEDGIGWSRVIEVLGERQEHAKRLLSLYHENVLPLEVIATQLQVPVPELMRAAALDPLIRPLFVEWSDAPSYEASVDAAIDAESLVITRSALATVQHLGLLDQLRSRYEIVAPMSLRWQLRLEVAEARKALESGRSTIMLAGHGPSIVEVASGDPRLVEELQAVEAALEWIGTHARLEARPIAAVGRPGSDDERLREQLGPASFDALSLSRAGLGRLFADDLGLRRLAGGAAAGSVSTITLLDALDVSGQLATADRDRLLIDLVLGGYEFVRPTSGMLADAVGRMPGLGREQLLRVFALLGGPLVTAQPAASMAAAAIKSTAGAPIEVTGVRVVAEAAARGMARRWPRQIAARLIVGASERELRLFPPRYLQDVAEACAEVAAEGIAEL